MADIAVAIAPSDYYNMAPRRSKSKYTPPPAVKATMLSTALEGTNRFPGAEQMSFLSGGKNRGDLRVHYAGDLSLLQRPCVSVVGTRDISPAGKRATEFLVCKLVQAGIVIVSGLAYGVDKVAHTTALREGGSAIAVIGTPLDKASPSENAALQEQIYRDHLLISQFDPGTATFPSNFPVRNRLMATISDATVVVEAHDNSGTLHQAVECTRLGRWLFIAKPVMDDPEVTWPKDFLRYKTCVVLERASQITDVVLRSSP